MDDRPEALLDVADTKSPSQSRIQHMTIYYGLTDGMLNREKSENVQDCRVFCIKKVPTSANNLYQMVKGELTNSTSCGSGHAGDPLITKSLERSSLN